MLHLLHNTPHSFFELPQILAFIASYAFVGSAGPKQSHKTKNTTKQPIVECRIVMNKMTANFRKNVISVKIYDVFECLRNVK